MKKLLRYLFFALLIAFIASCRLQSDSGEFSESELNEPLPISVVDAGQAAAIARAFVDDWLFTTPASGCGGWTADSSVGDVNPVYNDGKDGISYYECTIMTEGSPAGYVLVTTDNSDVLIPEFNTSGSSQYDVVKDRIGAENFLLYRYGLSGIRAVPKASGPSNPALQDAIYTDGISGFDANISAWRTKVESDGVIPYYTRRQFNALKLRSSEISANTYGDPEAKAGQSSVVSYASLAAGTPNWTQFYKKGSELSGSLVPNKDYPIGCGPVAWGIVYGYWQAKKGRPLLFNGTSVSDNYTSGGSYNPAIQGVITSIAFQMDTWWGDVNGVFGLTDPANMHKGINYGKSYYGASTVTRTLDALFQFNMYNKVYSSISGNRPCIISIYTSNGQAAVGPWVTHYVVVEQAKKTRYREKIFGIWFPWADGSTNYYVNMGWGVSNRWISTCDVDPYYTPEGALSSMWDVWDISVN